jgi:hypothetical protein
MGAGELAIIALGVVATVLLIVGAYRFSQWAKDRESRP